MTTNPDTKRRGSKNEFILSTGRTVLAWFRTIGLAPIMAGEKCAYALRASYGYDGEVDMTEWTPAEREELADYMIALWTEWRALQKQTTFPLSCCEDHRPLVRK